MQFISTNNALRPSGHYSQAIVHNGLAFISGQLAVDPETGEKRLASAGEEAQLILNNLDLILKEAGSDKNHVLKVTIFVSDIAYWDEVNQAYSEFFGDHKPARSVVPCKELHFGFKVEIEAIAAVK